MTKEKLKITIKKLIPKTWIYEPIIVKNKLKRTAYKKKKNKYLFILSPPYCGSTLLNELISTSQHVSVNNPFGTREGQTLPTVRKAMFGKNRWDENIEFDWATIKQEWLKYWDLTRPILLDKSPPNIIRAKSISQTFKSSFFIIFYRNPYAHCESLMRRENYTPKSAAKFALKCLTFQMHNVEDLKNSIQISYELLSEKPEIAVNLIQDFIPEIDDINHLQKFSAHNFLSENMEIKNLNKEKIGKLKRQEIKEINQVFSKKTDVLNFFNYSLLIDAENHEIISNKI